MIPSNNISRVYDPHTLSIMAIAFDRACDFLPVQFRGSDYMRRKLASLSVTLMTAKVIRRASPTRPSSPFFGNAAVGRRDQPSAITAPSAGLPSSYPAGAPSKLPTARTTCPGRSDAASAVTFPSRRFVCSKSVKGVNPGLPTRCYCIFKSLKQARDLRGGM